MSAINATARCTCCGVPLATADAEWRLFERCCPARLLPAPPRHEVDLYAGFVKALAATLDMREHGTGLHSRRVACHTLVLARRCNADPAWVRQVNWGALPHDLGNVGVPDDILLKKGPLDVAAWTIMRRHPERGERIVRYLPGMDTAADIVPCHEEGRSATTGAVVLAAWAATPFPWGPASSWWPTPSMRSPQIASTARN